VPELIQASFSKGEVGPGLYGRVDTAAYQVALRKAENVFIHAAGGASNRAGTRFKAPTIDASVTSRIKKFQFKATDTYLLEFGDRKMRVLRGGAPVLEVVQLIEGVLHGSTARIQATGHGLSSGDRVYVTMSSGSVELDGRFFHVGATTANDFEIYDACTLGAVTGVSPFVPASGIVSRVYTLATPYLAADLPFLKFSQSADVMTITHRDYEERRLTRSGHAAWTLTIPAYTPGIAAPTGLTAVGHPSFTGTDIDYYKVTAVSASGEESLAGAVTCTTSATPPFTGTNYKRNDIAWSAVAGAVKYSVYRAKGGVFGWLGDAVGATTFFDDNLSPDMGTAPPDARTPLAGAGNYPGTSGFFEQRQVFGGSTDAPDTSYYTRTGNFDSFSVSTPIQADDAITATLTAGEVNEIQHFVPGNDLLVMTSGAEWRVNAGTDSAFSATSIRQKPQSAWGSSHIRPVVVGNTVLYVPPSLISLRSLGYSVQADGYTGTDMTKLVPHFFRQYVIRDMAFVRSPEPLLVLVRTDGQACVLTFDQEQEVQGWARWKTAGSFEAVETVREDPIDPDETVYFVVKRTVNGAVCRYIEGVSSRRFVEVQDSFFVDAGVTHDQPITIVNVLPTNPVTIYAPGHGLGSEPVDVSGIEWVPNVDDMDTETQPDQLNGGRYTAVPISTDYLRLDGVDGSAFNAYVQGGALRRPVTSIGGLWHLEGRTVSILADGNVLPPQAVAQGRITLDRPYSRVHAGLRYVAEIMTLSPEIPRSTTVQAKSRRVPQIMVRFERSRGLIYAVQHQEAGAEFYELAQREFEDYGQPTDLLTGDAFLTTGDNWGHDSFITLRQRDPLPMTISAVVYDMEGLG